MMSHGSERAFQLVVEALRQLETERIRRTDAIPALVDISVSLALMDGGVEAAEEIIGRVYRRIDSWRGGDAPAAVEPSPKGRGSRLSASVGIYSD
jgi:hypothetical protein